MDVRFKGVAIGIFLFSTTIVGTIAVSVNAELIKVFGVTDNPEGIGKIVGFSTSVPCIFAAVCFWRAGIHYAKQKAEIDSLKEASLVKVVEYNVDLTNESITALMKMDLRGLTHNSIREGDSSIYAPFLKSSDSKAPLKRLNTTQVFKPAKI